MDGNDNELFRPFLPNLCHSKLRKTKIFRLFEVVAISCVHLEYLRHSTVFGNDVGFVENN